MKAGDRTPGAPDETTSTSGTPDASGEVTDTDARRNPFRPVVVLMVLVLLGLVATAGFKSYRDMDSAKDYERELLQEIAETEARVQGLERRIDSIRHDPVTLERLAREDLGMVRAGDVVIVLPDPRRVGASPVDASPVDVSPADVSPADAGSAAPRLATASPSGRSSSDTAQP